MNADHLSADINRQAHTRAEEIAAREEKIRTLSTAAEERDRLAGDVGAFQIKIQILEGEVRAAELKAALMAKDLKMSEGRHRSLLEVMGQREERVVHLRATVGLMVGQIASLTTMMNRALPEVSRPGPSGSSGSDFGTGGRCMSY